MDHRSVYSLSIGFGDSGRDAEADTRSKVQQQIIDFILQFRVDNQFVYRDQIRENVLAKRYYCDVNMSHLISFNEELAHRLSSEPADMIPLVCSTSA